MKVGVQLRQTIISTGAVGACLGAVVVLGLLVVGPGSDARLVAQGIAPPSWGAVATGYLIAFVTRGGCGNNQQSRIQARNACGLVEERGLAQ
jgi:hypothetical protein